MSWDDLPVNVRDTVLREIGPILGFDFWALDEVQKSDVSEEMEIAFTEWLAAQENEWRDRACEIFGVSTAQDDQEIFDALENERDSRLLWKNVYMGLRKDVHVAVGLDDGDLNEDAVPDDVRNSETCVAHIEEARALLRKQFPEDSHASLGGIVESIIERLEKAGAAVSVDGAADSTVISFEGEVFMKNIRESLGLGLDASNASIMTAIGRLREDAAGRRVSEEQVKSLARQVGNLDAALLAKEERIRALESDVRPQSQPPKALEDALHVQIGHLREDLEKAQGERRAAEPENVARPHPERPSEGAVALFEALGVPSDTAPDVVRARIEQLLRAERGLIADLASAGALL